MPDKLSICDRLSSILVRPFVESVIQYYGYGHWKDSCKKSRRCVICGEKYHGRCDKKSKYVNCKGEHKANGRSCEAYKRQVQVKRIIAIEGWNQYEVRIRTFHEEEVSQVEESIGIKRKDPEVV